MVQLTTGSRATGSPSFPSFIPPRMPRSTSPAATADRRRNQRCAHPVSSDDAPPVLPPIRSVRSLVDADNLTEPAMLVHGLLHQGTKGILAGASKTGKTWMLMDLAISVASGTRFLSWPTTVGRVLFVNMEIQEAFLRSRFQAMFAARSIPPVDGLDVLTLRGEEMGAGELLRALEARLRGGRYALVIIDPIYKLMVGRSEVGSTGVGILCAQIERLVVSTGAAVVYAHHFPKGVHASKRPLDRLSGSGVFGRDADTILTLTEHQVDDCYTVEATVRNLPSPPPVVMEWDFPRIVLRSDLEPEALRVTATAGGRRGLAIVLGALVRPLSHPDWLQASVDGGVSRATFFRARQRLEAQGLVVLVPATGMWHRTNPAGGETILGLAETIETATAFLRAPAGAPPLPSAPPSAPAATPPVASSLPPFETERRIYIPPDPDARSQPEDTPQPVGN